MLAAAVAASNDGRLKDRRWRRERDGVGWECTGFPPNFTSNSLLSLGFHKPKPKFPLRCSFFPIYVSFGQKHSFARKLLTS